MSPLTRETTEKINTRDCTKQKRFYTAKETINKAKLQNFKPDEWEKIFTNDTTRS